MTRPYFKASIEELEAAFNSRRQDSVFLAALLDELGFRTTLRAGRLRQQVQQQIDSWSERSGTAIGRQRAIKHKLEPSSLPQEIPLAETPPVDRWVPSEYPPITNTP